MARYGLKEELSLKPAPYELTNPLVELPAYLGAFVVDDDWSTCVRARVFGLRFGARGREAQPPTQPYINPPPTGLGVLSGLVALGFRYLLAKVCRLTKRGGWMGGWTVPVDWIETPT